MKCDRCGSDRHTTEEKSCCNCAHFLAPNEKCGKGSYTTRNAVCSMWEKEVKLMEMEVKSDGLSHIVVLYIDDLENNNLAQIRRLINVKCNNAKESMMGAVIKYKEEQKDGKDSSI